MCGRLTLFEADKILSREFGFSGFSTLVPRYNIAPSQPVATVRAAPADGGRCRHLCTPCPLPRFTC